MCSVEGSNFLKNSSLIAEGDTVIIYINQNTQYAIVVKRGITLHMKYGALRHEFLIGKHYGTAILATAGYVYVLRANPDLWTRTLNKRTQILYTPDIATILLLMDIKPGSIVCESGTGSGSLTHAIATAICPNGHLYSHDIEESRLKAVQSDINAHGLSENVTIVLRDVCTNGFVANDCDSIFLDLPSPWNAISYCKKSLNKSRGGRLVSFSPCIEQVQQVITQLELHAFVEIETIEIVSQRLKVVNVISEDLLESASQGSNVPLNFSRRADSTKDGKFESEDDALPKMDSADCINNKAILDTIPFPYSQPTHTGYLTSATLLPNVEFFAH